MDSQIFALPQLLEAKLTHLWKRRQRGSMPTWWKNENLLDNRVHVCKLLLQS